MAQAEKTQQLTIFDFIKFADDTEPDILLVPGETVFVIRKGDVVPYHVLEETWVCEKERFYRLKNTCYAVAKNSDLGNCVFRDQEDALRIAEGFLSSHDVVRAENIDLEDIQAYHYIRDCDKDEMIAFCGSMGGGKLYLKGFITYACIVPDTKKTREKFAKEVANAEKFEYQPVLKNMYKCSDLTDWEYTEAGCSYGVG